MNEQPATQLKDSRQSIILILLIVLLSVQVIISGYGLYRDVQKDKMTSELLTAVNQYILSNSALSDKLLKDYEENVYNNPRVDSAVKQQVIANDYIVGYLKLIAEQNNQLLQLLAGMP